MSAAEDMAAGPAEEKLLTGWQLRSALRCRTYVNCFTRKGLPYFGSHQTDPNPKNDSITRTPEMTHCNALFSLIAGKKRSDNCCKAAVMQDLHRRNTVGDMLYMVGFWVSMFLSA